MTKKTDGESGADTAPKTTPADTPPKPTAAAAKPVERPSKGGSYTRAADGSLTKQEG